MRYYIYFKTQPQNAVGVPIFKTHSKEVSMSHDLTERGFEPTVKICRKQNNRREGLRSTERVFS